MLDRIFNFSIPLLVVGLFYLIYLNHDKSSEYIEENNCDLVGYTRDMNGANTGGVTTVYLCGDGTYYLH